MSLSTTTNRSDRTLNGVATVFSFDFKIFSESDLQVILVDGTTGAESTLTLGVDYTVSGVNADAGSITLVAGPGTSGDKLVLKRVVQLTQPTRLRNQGDFFPATHERAFDRAVMISQQLKEELDRVPHLSSQVEGFGLDMGVPAPLDVVAVNAAGDSFEFRSINEIATASYTITTVKDHTATAGQTVFTTASPYVPHTNGVSVYLNGVRLISVSDYTETDENTITLTTGATLGDTVSVVSSEGLADPTGVAASNTLRADLASPLEALGPALIGFDDGNTYPVDTAGAAIQARVKTADLAAPTGAGLVGSVGGITVQEALDATRNATMTDQFAWAPPADFIATGLTFTRDGNGNYTSSFNPDTYAASMAYTRTIYVNRATGSDTTGDGTSGLPYKTPAKAFAIAQAGADTSVRVLIVTGGADVLFYRDEWVVSPSTINGKKFYITTDDNTKKAYATSAQATPSWALTGGKTYTFQTSRTSTLNVIDMSNKDVNGIPIPYIRKSSIDEVEALAGSWWTDGTIVYVHTLAGTTPVNGTHLVNIEVSTFTFDLQNSAEVFVRNCYFAGSSVPVIRNATSDLTNHAFTAYNCGFSAMFSAGSSNGVNIESVKKSLFVSCIFAYNGSDGFNAHYTRIGAADPKGYLAACVGCLSYLNGTGYTLTANTNNAFTTHEGASALYVSCSGYTCNGPIFANVNACYSVLAGCRGWGSTGATTHGAFYFDGAGGIAVMRDCVGSDPVYDLNTDGNVTVSLEDCTIGTASAAASADTSVRFSSFLRKNAPTDSGVIPGYGSPEGIVTAPVGTMYRRLDGTTGKTLYIKETGSGNTGWVAK